MAYGVFSPSRKFYHITRTVWVWFGVLYIYIHYFLTYFPPQFFETGFANEFDRSFSSLGSQHMPGL